MKETLQALRATPAQLETVYQRLEGLKRLDLPREPGKWTPRQIVHHLADIEVLNGYRFLGWLTDSAVRLVPAQQDAYAATGHYDARDPLVSVEAFKALRAKNLDWLDQLSPEEWEHPATHPTRGEFRLAQWAEFIVNHDANHLAQLEASLG